MAVAPSFGRLVLFLLQGVIAHFLTSQNSPQMQKIEKMVWCHPGSVGAFLFFIFVKARVVGGEGPVITCGVFKPSVIFFLI